MRYDNRVTIITGGSQGIGEGCVRAFARAGSNVVFCSIDETRGNQLAEELNQASEGEILFIKCDVTKQDQLENLVNETITRFDRLDCLINNAGWHPPHKPVDDFSADDFRALLELNVISVFSLSKLALPHLRQTRGNIINIASLVATLGQHYATTYVATKGAVLSFTKALAIDEAPNGVRVNSVSPGNIYTPLWQAGIDEALDPVKWKESGENAQLLGRLGTIEEAGKLCLFIAAEATFTTGVDHILSGGAELDYGQKSRMN
ncbi:MAG TPA: SDR family oxidoreductase [Blastocatellia bacterium]|nr:SDR family oxidoreductase [Blastocatellia bacterium]